MIRKIWKEGRKEERKKESGLSNYNSKLVKSQLFLLVIYKGYNKSQFT